jgi:hypothetical protein
MTPETRAELTHRMDEGLYAGLPGGAAVEDIVAQAGRDSVIEQLSGTTDRSSRAWKNARDNLSRWRRGARHPSQVSQQGLRSAAEASRRGEIRAAGRAHVRVSATVRTSSKTWGYADADLTGPVLDDFVAAREAGNDELAAQIVFDAYGLDPDMIVSLEGVEGFEISW